MVRVSTSPKEECSKFFKVGVSKFSKKFSTIRKLIKFCILHPRISVIGLCWKYFNIRSNIKLPLKGRLGLGSSEWIIMFVKISVISFWIETLERLIFYQALYIAIAVNQMKLTGVYFKGYDNTKPIPEPSYSTFWSLLPINYLIQSFSIPKIIHRRCTCQLIESDGFYV